VCAQSGAVCALVAHAISLTPHYFLVRGKGIQASSYCPHKAPKVSRDAPWCCKN